MTQVHEALSSNLNTTKTKQKKEKTNKMISQLKQKTCVTVLLTKSTVRASCEVL
jgi:hypothetical protein